MIDVRGLAYASASASASVSVLVSARRAARAIGAVATLIVCCALHATATAQALDKDIQADILSRKIVTLIESGRIAQSVPIFEELEALGIPLPETVQFYYIQALDKAGKSKAALLRATAYLRTYGRQGKNYDGAVEAVSRLTDVVKQQELQVQRQMADEAEQARKRAEQEAAALKASQEKVAFEQLQERLRDDKYQAALKKYELDRIEYAQLVASAEKRAQECVPRIREDLNSCEAGVQKREGGFFSDRAKLQRGMDWCWDRYNPDHCERVNRVQTKAPERPVR